MDVKSTRLKNLRALVKQAGSTAKLARTTGTSASYFSQILNGIESRTGTARSLGDRKAREMEQALGLSQGWMDIEHTPVTSYEVRDGADNVRPLEIQGSPRKYPLISWVQAGSWAEAIDNFQPGDADDWILAPPGVRPSESAFWLEVAGMSMFNPSGWPSFPPGSYVFCDPAIRECQTGKFVVARLNETNEQTFKQLNCEDGRIYLQPLNPQYPVIQISQETQIIGTITGLTMSL